MIKEYEYSGKTIDEAIQNGLNDLGVSRDDVSIEVLRTAQRGFLGIGSTDATIKLTMEIEGAEEDIVIAAPVAPAAPEPKEKKPAKSIKAEPAKAARSVGPRDSNIDSKEENKAQVFLGEVCKIMGANIVPEIEEKDGQMSISLSGDDLGIVIGHRGETLDALQYLTSIVVNRGREEYVKVTVDAQNYRKKREDTLSQLAHRIANKVLATKRNMALEPMSAYERRIIHYALQDVQGITTFSTGQDPNRKVVIALERRAKAQRKEN